MGFRTVFIESRCRCSYSGGYLVVRKDTDTVKVHLSEISSIILQTTQVYISAYLLMELARAKVPLIVSDDNFNPVGEYLPIYGAHNPAKRVQEQLEWGEVVKKRVWQSVARSKIGHQADMLECAGFPEQSVQLRRCVADVKSGDVTNREAYAAKLYFGTLFGPDFTRNDDCPVNAALNYGYAVLLSLVNREIVSRGYLTQRGIHHISEYNKFNLGSDLMEPFRPLVDRMVVENVGMDFDRSDRLFLGDLANQRISYRDGTYRLGSVVSLYVQDCLNALCKRIPVEDIQDYDFD